MVLSGKLEARRGRTYIIRERPQKIAFERLIPLGAKTIPGKAKATLKNGILEIAIPKAEPTRKQAVKIEVK